VRWIRATRIVAGGSSDRYAYVLGSREITLRLVSRAPVIKGRNADTCEEVASPSELAPLRRRLGLDYGKIDVVVPEGRSVRWTSIRRRPRERSNCTASCSACPAGRSAV